MSKPKAVFAFNNAYIPIECSKEEKMKDICQKYSIKIETNVNCLLFLYSGNKINFESKFIEQANPIDRENNEMNILVYKNDNDGFVCPKCGEKIKFNTDKINDIILNNNNDSTFFENKNNNNIHNKRKINFKNNLQIFNSSNNSSFNELSFNSSTNNNNNLEDFFSNKKTGAYNLLKKIKKSINNITTEIDSEKQKYEKIKRSLFLTKLNELNIESNLLEEQINKINTFIQRDIQIQEENHKKKDNLLNLQLNIERQEKIIKSLNERSNYLDKEEENLKLKLEEMKKKLESKTKKISINNKKLSLLIQKNNTLSKNKEQSTKNTKEIKINNNKVKNPDQIKTYYTGEISKLNKIINFYSSQCVFSEKEIARLKEQHIKAEVINNKEVIKPIKSNYNYNKNLIKYNTHL